MVKDALRSNTVDLFAAAVCENDFASEHLPDELLFQAALKCLFVGLRIDRIVRIEERTSAELARMLFGYVTEREHAGRPVAPELWPLVGLFAPKGAAALMEARLSSMSERADAREKSLLELGLSRARRALSKR